MELNVELIYKTRDFILDKIEEFNKVNEVKIEKPELALILGSGLGSIGDTLENALIIKYSDIPNFKKSHVEGHKDQFVIGKFMGKNVIVMQGRYHFYEGHSIEVMSLPIYTLKALGVEKLIVTNACGGVNESFKPGTLMLITDHINFTSCNPLIGKNLDEFGTRFPDMTNAYTKKLQKVARDTAIEVGVDLKEGVYLMYSGPNYETPAEIRAFRILGADAVGMSTVPEVLIANHCSMEVVGISCITNLAAGILDKPLNHEEVLEVSNRVKGEFTSLISKLVENI